MVRLGEIKPRKSLGTCLDVYQLLAKRLLDIVSSILAEEIIQVNRLYDQEERKIELSAVERSNEVTIDIVINKYKKRKLWWNKRISDDVLVRILFSVSN